jgi:ATP adenylyltransferase
MNGKNSSNFVHAKSISACPFCYENIKSEIIETLHSVCAIKDKYPVTENHILIIPIRHSEDFFSLTTNERRDAEKLLFIMKKRISEQDSSVTGFNIGANSGKSAGQTIFHAHIHLIPRRDGDTPNPRGGVRGVIPDKMSY